MRKLVLIAALTLLAIPMAARSAPAAAPDSGARVIHVATAGNGPVNQRITMSLNKAVIVQLDSEAHDVLVSSPDIVDAVVRSPKRIFLLALKAGQTNAFFFDASGRQILSLDIRVEKDVVDLSAIMKDSLPDSAIAVQAMNDNIVLTGKVYSATESLSAFNLAAGFTGDPKKVVNMLTVAGGEQVLLKVRMAEMDRNIAKQFGVNVGAALSSAGVPIMAATSNPFGLLGRALSEASGAQIGQMCPAQFFPTVTNAVTQTAAAATSLATGLSGAVNGGTALTGVGTGTVTTINPATGLPVVSGSITSTLTPTNPLTGSTTAGITGTQNLTNATGVNSTLSSTNPVCANNAQGILQALEQVGLVHILAEPDLTAVSGETAKFLAGGSFPVPAGKDNQGNVTLQFKDFGVGLSFTPVVLGPGRISLQISTEVSELTNTGAFILQGGTSTLNGVTSSTGGVSVPALTVRRAETTVELPSGGSFAVAGLMQHTTKQVIDGFPGLKDMPVLGALFRSRDFQNDETELVVLVSAYLVQPTTEAALATPTQGFVAPTDPETLLLGRLNAVYTKNATPIVPQAAAPVGYVVR